MNDLIRKRPWLAVLLVWCGFVALSQALKYLVLPNLPAAPWMGQAGLKLLVIATVAVLARLTGCNRACLGLDKLSFRGGYPYWTIGLGLGALSSLLMLSTRQTGLSRVLGAMSFPALVLWVWIVSSVSEEFLCRGWFQGLLARWSGTPDDRAKVILPSAILFGSLHLTLLLAGVPPISVFCLLAATTALGHVCALARARSNNLGPAVAAISPSTWAA